MIIGGSAANRLKNKRKTQEIPPTHAIQRPSQSCLTTEEFIQKDQESHTLRFHALGSNLFFSNSCAQKMKKEKSNSMRYSAENCSISNLGSPSSMFQAKALHYLMLCSDSSRFSSKIFEIMMFQMEQ